MDHQSSPPPHTHAHKHAHTHTHTHVHTHPLPLRTTSETCSVASGTPPVSTWLRTGRRSSQGASPSSAMVLHTALHCATFTPSPAPPTPPTPTPATTTTPSDPELRLLAQASVVNVKKPSPASTDTVMTTSFCTWSSPNPGPK